MNFGSWDMSENQIIIICDLFESRPGTAAAPLTQPADDDAPHRIGGSASPPSSDLPPSIPPSLPKQTVSQHSHLPLPNTNDAVWREEGREGNRRRGRAAYYAQNGPATTKGGNDDREGRGLLAGMQ